MRIILALAPALAGLFGVVTAAAAQAPVAVVEDIQGKVSGVEFMDYVTSGQVIKLGPKDSIVLGYMKSCWRETITGGTVVIGAEQSLVHQGDIQRVKVNCDGGKLSDRHASESAATVFRSLTPAQRAATPPQLTLYGTAPVFALKDDSNFVVERLDKRDERIEITPRGKALVRGKFYDFAKAGKALAPGGTYVASSGSLSVVFKIDPQAKPGAEPIVSRLLRLE